MSDLLARAAYIVEELGDLYDRARECGDAEIVSAVGAKFEKRVHSVLAEIEAAGILSEVPEA